MDIKTVAAAFQKGEHQRADVLLDAFFDSCEKPETNYLRGTLRLVQSRPGMAEVSLRKAVEAKPDFDQAYVNLIVALKSQGKNKEAIDEALKAISRFSHKWEYALKKGKRVESAASIYVNLGSTYLELGSWEKALEAYDNCLKFDPHNPDGNWNRSLAQLAMGDWTGWDGYEWGFRKRERQSRPYWDEIDHWKGQPLEGKTLLVSGEQGLGDEILFSSCIPDLVERGGKIIFDCHPRLGPIFKRSFDIEVSPTRKLQTPGLFDDYEIDYQVPIGRLPRFFRRRDEDFPGTPFLKADPDSVRQWRENLGNKVVGLSWRGGTSKTGGMRRSLPLSELAGSVYRDDITFVSLQYGDEVWDEVATFNRDYKADVKHFAHAIEDYNETFNLVAACDLVISVQTALLHVAGSLGVETWGLIPDAPHWQWGPDRCHWYSSLKVYKQPERYDWRSVLKRIEGDFRAWV